LEYLETIAKKDNAKFSNKINILPKNLDLAIISLPTEYHLECFKNLISKVEIKKIILEKPVGCNYLESKNIYDLTIKNNLNLYVNYMRNTLPETEIIYNFIKQNKLNKFDIEISVTGSFLNNGSHFLSLISHLTNLSLSNLEVKKLNSRIIFFKNERIKIILKKNQEVKYPFFKVNMLHESGLIEYDEVKNKWNIFNFDESSENVKYKKLVAESSYKLNLKFAQEYFLDYVLSGANPNFKKIDISTAMIIQKLLA